MSSTALAEPAPAVAHPAPKLILAAFVAATGDQLFHDRDLGLSVVLFLGLLGVTAVIANPLNASARDRGLAAAFLVAGLLPLVESVSLLSMAFGALGLGLFAVGLRGAFTEGWRAACAAAGTLLLAGPVRLVPDLSAAIRHGGLASLTMSHGTALLGWIVPLLLCGVFAVLFASANPVIDAWIAAADASITLPSVGPGRVLAWFGLLSVAWAFVSIRVRTGRIRLRSARVPTEAGLGDLLPADTALGDLHPEGLIDVPFVLRCLALFNLLFAVQTALDATYLWGGIALPPGITYAAYAHRGAYPLILTALLAAAFVLVALRPGGPGEQSTAIRALVTLWIGQTVLLVISALLRLDLYVATYSLTLTRAAAFVWMGLVGVGLLLILARITLRRGNAWLVAANGIALAATLYACAFVNLSGFVADYNLDRSRNGGAAFDVHYALSLGPAAIPAIDRLIAEDVRAVTPVVIAFRDRLARQHVHHMRDWRAWTFRGRRLLDYLQGRVLVPPADPATTGGVGTP